LLWSFETALSKASRVSKESHSGFALQPLRKMRKENNISRLLKFGIDVSHPMAKPNRLGKASFQVSRTLSVNVRSEDAADVSSRLPSKAR
jgi:hypothetical protein